MSSFNLQGMPPQTSDPLEESQYVRLAEIEPRGPHLPIDILGLLPYHLRRKELLAFAATAKALRTPSRAHLFRNVAVANTSSLPSLYDDVFLIQTEHIGEVEIIFPDIGGMICSLTLFHDPNLGSSHWITNTDAFNVVKFCTFLSHCSNLETFSISREFENGTGSNDDWWQWYNLDDALQNAIQQAINLPSLKDLRIHEHIIFPNPRLFCEVFAAKKQSSLVKLELADAFFVGKQLHTEVAGTAATLESLKLAYIDGSLTPSILLSAASPFSLSQLRSLELCGLGPMDDGWIASLLDAQESPSTLIHLALLNFEGYPQGTAFLRSMERFTSIRTLHLSEDADGSEESYESSTKLYCLPFWLSSLPVRKTVEELVIHVNDLQHDSAVISSLDEIISDKDTMPRLKRVVVRINLSEMELKPMVKEEMENWLSTAQSGELIETRYFYGEREVDV